jgi:hypothetical protein
MSTLGVDELKTAGSAEFIKKGFKWNSPPGKTAFERAGMKPQNAGGRFESRRFVSQLIRHVGEHRSDDFFFRRPIGKHPTDRPARLQRQVEELSIENNSILFRAKGQPWAKHAFQLLRVPTRQMIESNINDSRLAGKGQKLLKKHEDALDVLRWIFPRTSEKRVTQVGRAAIFTQANLCAGLDEGGSATGHADRCPQRRSIENCRSEGFKLYEGLHFADVDTAVGIAGRRRHGIDQGKKQLAGNPGVGIKKHVSGHPHTLEDFPWLLSVRQEIGNGTPKLAHPVAEFHKS